MNIRTRNFTGESMKQFTVTSRDDNRALFAKVSGTRFTFGHDPESPDYQLTVRVNGTALTFFAKNRRDMFRRARQVATAYAAGEPVEPSRVRFAKNYGEVVMWFTI